MLLKQKRIYNMNMRDLINIIESNIVDFDSAKKDKELRGFHKDFMNTVQTGVRGAHAAMAAMNEQGLFDDLPVGSRIRLPKGGSYKVIRHSVTRSKTGTESTLSANFRKEHGFGPAYFLPTEDGFYTPLVILRREDTNGDYDEGSHNLDKLINFETGEKRYVKFTGPQR